MCDDEHDPCLMMYRLNELNEIVLSLKAQTGQYASVAAETGKELQGLTVMKGRIEAAEKRNPFCNVNPGIHRLTSFYEQNSKACAMMMVPSSLHKLGVSFSESCS